MAVPEICPLGEGVVIEIDRLFWMPSWMSVTAVTGMIHGRPAKGSPAETGTELVTVSDGGVTLRGSRR